MPRKGIEDAEAPERRNEAPGARERPCWSEMSRVAVSNLTMDIYIYGIILYCIEYYMMLYVLILHLSHLNRSLFAAGRCS